MAVQYQETTERKKEREKRSKEIYKDRGRDFDVTKMDNVESPVSRNTVVNTVCCVVFATFSGTPFSPRSQQPTVVQVKLISTCRQKYRAASTVAVIPGVCFLSLSPSPCLSLGGGHATPEARSKHEASTSREGERRSAGDAVPLVRWWSGADARPERRWPIPGSWKPRLRPARDFLPGRRDHGEKRRG